MGNSPSFLLQDEEIKLISDETGFTPSQIERLYSRFTALDKSGNGSLSRQDCLAIPELAINPLCDRIVQMFFSDCDDDHERINFRQFMKVLATFRSSDKPWSPGSRTRNILRRESLNYQQHHAILKQAPLLFDSIDPYSISTTPFTRHSRHSSYHDGFYDYVRHQHHTTNQHSIHYAASTNHLPALNGHHNNEVFLHPSCLTGDFKKPHNPRLPHVDLDEPANSRKQKMLFLYRLYDVNNDNLIDLSDLISIIKMMVGTYIEEARIRAIAERTLREADKNCDGYIDFDEFCANLIKKDINESLKVKFSSKS